MTIIGDNPIREPSQDRLGRAPLAESLAEQILHADASEGLVVGILGPWGAGKTSFVNLVRHHLAESVPVLDFNPWLFSGSEHLVEAFLSELTAHVKVKLELGDIGDMLETYGDYLSAAPFVGAWAARAKLLFGAAGSWKGPQRSQIEATRDKISTALKQRELPIIVLLDDLDRLTAGEIRDIFRLVRLTASFPNIVYVLSFDRHQVERALSADDPARPQEDPTGRAYLEKIVQLVLDLPAISGEVLLDELIAAINESLADIDDEAFDEHRWSSVLIHVIMPLMKNVRDVRRYCASIRGTVTDAAGEICLPDILSLEVVRLFLPDVFMQLRDAVGVITSSLEARVEDPSAAESARQRVQEIVDSGDNHRGVVEALLEHVFPDGGRHLPDRIIFGGSPRDWYHERRVASTEIFRLYLERREGQTLGWQRRGDHALSVMTHAEEFQSYLQSLTPESLRHVIASLETHEDRFQPEQVIPGVTVLLNMWPTMPEHRGGFIYLDNRVVVSRMVLRLLRVLGSPAEVSSAVEELAPQLETLSAELLLTTIVGHRESAGHRLVPAEDAERFERSFRDRVREATVDVLVRDHDLLTVMYRARKDASASEPELVVCSDPEVTRSMLESSKHEDRSVSVGGPVRYTNRLQWGALVESYGDEAVLRERINELRAHQPEDLDDLLELAERYAGDWRPPDWPEDGEQESARCEQLHCR